MSKAARSALMSKVRNKHTKPELIVRSRLHHAGFRFRLHDKSLPGTPDLVLKKHRTAIFVNGCFWHGHGCKKSKLPATRTEFWQAKIERNKARDAQQKRALTQQGWAVFTIWECKLEGDLSAAIRHLSTKNDPKRMSRVVPRTNNEYRLV